MAQSQPQRPSNEAVEIARTVAWALLIALVLRVVVFQPYTIPSESMEPALLKGDYIVVSKYSYGWSAHSIPFSPPLFHGRILGRGPARGDVVVFHLPRDRLKTLIKRVIGLPGDRIQLRGGVVFVNGRPIPRASAGETLDPGMPGLQVAAYRETAPDGRTYLTFDQGPGHDGDDTEVYVVPEGRYFMMGDNRDNSLDSRWPGEVGVGFVPAENIVGKAQFVLMSWDGVSLFEPWTWVTRIRPGRFLVRLGG